MIGIVPNMSLNVLVNTSLLHYENSVCNKGIPINHEMPLKQLSGTAIILDRQSLG